MHYKTKQIFIKQSIDDQAKREDVVKNGRLDDIRRLEEYEVDLI